MLKIHASITPERIADACDRSMTTLDNPGFCIACGAEQEDCEPDMGSGRCDRCGQHDVYGAEELAIRLL